MTRSTSRFRYGLSLLACSILAGYGCTPFVLLPDEVKKLREDVTQLSSVQKETSNSLVSATNDQTNALNQLTATVAGLRTKLDQATEELEILKLQLAEAMQLINDLSSKTSGTSGLSMTPVVPIEPSHALPVPAKDVASTPKSTLPPPASASLPPLDEDASQVASRPKQDAVTLYGEAYGCFRDNDFDGAIRGFQSLLDSHPESDLADNALFWVGECYLQLNRLAAAEKAFKDTCTQYPEGNKVPDAMYKLGHAQLLLNKMDEAVATWREVISRYPGEPAAMKARQQLQSLGR